MGFPKRVKIIMLVACLSFVMLVMTIGRNSGAQRTAPAPRLFDSLQAIEGWSTPVANPLDELVVSELRLDDYVSLVYTQNQQNVSLYVGYYIHSEKVGAAHDPLVCFPGQGWTLSQRNEGTIKVDIGGNTPAAISYASMIGQAGSARELIVYWFQAYDRTSTGTFMQKIILTWRRIVKKGSANAFVRITTPIDDQSTDEEHAAIENFIKAFYPAFFKYMTRDQG